MDILHQRLLESLENIHHQFPHQRSLVVGYSGGLDSAALLDACVQTREHWAGWFPGGLRALHVHHGLSSNADEWLTHCERSCHQYQVPLTTARVQLASPAGGAATGNVEERAREARYQAFKDHLQVTDVLLLAHHQDDQAETVLLRLLRGSGERGLAGMPITRMLTGQIPLHRPWLTMPRSQLERFAIDRQLRWVDDESNLDDRYDRNFLRQRLLPLVEQRWPGWRQTIARSARYNAEANALLAEQTQSYLQRWMEAASDSQAWFSRLACEPMLSLAEGWQQRLVRTWLHDQTGQWPDEETTLRCWRLFGSPDAEPEASTYDIPGSTIPLRAVDSTAVKADHIRWPQQHWRGIIFRRYRGHVYACPADVDVPPAPAQGYQWEAGPDGRFPILMLPGNGNLRWYLVNEGGMRRPHDRCEIRYRQGGEEAALVGRPRRSLKKILQEAGVVPWQRHRVPLVYVDGELAWIGGVGVCEGHQARPGETAWALRWHDVLPPQE